MESANTKRFYLVIITMLSVFILWQLSVLFKHNSKTTVPSVVSLAKKPKLASSDDASTHSDVSKVVKSVSNKTQAKPKLKLAVKRVEKNKLSLDHPTLSQQQLDYIQLVNSYKVSQVKRMIAQDEEAIAIASEHAAKARQSRMKLLASMANVRGADVQIHHSAFDPKLKQLSNAKLKLLYTGQQSGFWNATLKYDGEIQDVTLGSKLSDGSKVIAINKDMVVLSKGLKRTLVGFYDISEQIFSPNTVVKSKTKPSRFKVAAARKKLETKKLVKHKSSAKNAQASLKSKPLIIKPHKKAKSKVQSVAKAHSPAPHHYSAQENWLLKLPQSEYTIQLTANQRREAVEHYIKSNGLTDKVKIYQSTSHGLPWFVGVYSHYKDADAAMDEIANLPIKLQRFSPFMKSVKDVQAEIKAAA